MISQSCPRCHSKRIRRGYRPTALWSKVLFRYNLLCDGCNWEFKGFAVPGTVTSKPTKRRKTNEKVENKTGNITNVSLDNNHPRGVKKRIKVRL